MGRAHPHPHPEPKPKPNPKPIAHLGPHQVLPSDGPTQSASERSSFDFRSAPVQVDELGELEALDVSVTASEADADEQRAERQAVLLDAALMMGEATLGTLTMRLARLLTPEESRSFELLRAFRLQRSPAEQRAARAKERLLDELVQGISRR